MRDKGPIWDSSNCEYECDQSCDVGGYFDYEKCNCRKKFVDKLVDECTENIYEVEIAGVTLTENMNRCSSCILYLALFSIILQLKLELVLIFLSINI